MAINFLPWREAAYGKKQRVFSGLFLTGLILMMVMIWAINECMNQKKQRIRQDHQALLKQIQMFQNKNKAQQAVFFGDQRKQEKLLWISEVFQKENKFPLFLEKLGKMNFTERYLIQMSFEKDQLKLKGIAVSVLNIFHFMEALRHFSEVKQVQFLGAEKLQDGVQFNLAVKFN